MTKNKKSNSVVVGAPSKSEFEFIVHHNIEDLDKLLKVELPGEVVQVQKTTYLAIIPATRILSIDKKKNLIGAEVHFAEKKYEETKKIMNQLRKKIKDRHIQKYKLIFKSKKITYENIIQSVKKSGKQKYIPISVDMFVSIGLMGVKNPIISQAIPAQVAVRPLPVPQEYELDYQDGFGPIFDCHSHWLSESKSRPNPRDYTVCHGKCPSGGSCTCTGTNQRVKVGWNLCWC